MTEAMEDALVRLGETLAAAVLAALQEAVPGEVEVVGIDALLEYAALTEVVRPSTVVADASSVDGAAGRALLCLAPSDLRPVLSGAPADSEAPAAAGSPTEAELTALSTLADRLNGAAAEALGGLLGQRVRYEEARASLVEDPRFVVRPGPVQAICTRLAVGGAEVRLIQFAPNALVMRAAHAFEDLAEDAFRGAPENAGAGPSPETLGTMQLRVWAELGRTELALADALALPSGAVVELAEDADAPVDLMVNGMRYGTGRLIVTDDGEWAMVLDEIDPEGVVELTAG